MSNPDKLPFFKVPKKFTVGIDVASGKSETVISFVNAQTVVSLDGPFSGANRPKTRNDVIERLMKYEWGRQLDILSYMKRFQTWDALYAHLDRMAAGKGPDEMRNVTPAVPKQIEENT